MEHKEEMRQWDIDTLQRHIYDREKRLIKDKFESLEGLATDLWAFSTATVPLDSRYNFMFVISGK